MIKLKIRDQPKWEQHRSGWKFALRCLEIFNDESGILFDGLIDDTFGFSAEEKKRVGIIPYTEDWIGFTHSSVSLCQFMKNYPTIDSILGSDEFIQSLAFCKGIFTLSEYLAEYLRAKMPSSTVKIVSVKHPTEFSSVIFDIDKFVADKKVVHIGSWLRRMTSFLKLNAHFYKRILLLNPGTMRSLKEELRFYKDFNFNLNDIEIWQHLSDQEYDHLLSEAIVFIHLCDSSATNTVIECMVRNTPILINRSQPVEEYLGKDYPFYYSCLEEANEKLQNEDLIQAAHEYLVDHPGKQELTDRHFVSSFVNSSIIQHLDQVII
jgi:hypothetical protein